MKPDGVNFRYCLSKTVHSWNILGLRHWVEKITNNKIKICCNYSNPKDRTSTNFENENKSSNLSIPVFYDYNYLKQL